MKANIHGKTMSMSETSLTHCMRTGALAALLVLASLPSFARDDRGGRGLAYAQSNLVSDVAGTAQITDPDMTNAWGVSFSACSPFWISDNGTGKSTLYTVTNDS